MQEEKGSMHQKVIDMDLNQLFKLQYSFDPLKQVIEALARRMDQNESSMKDYIKTITSGLVDKLGHSEYHSKDLGQQLAELKERIALVESQAKDQKEKLNSLEVDQSRQDSEIEELKERPPSSPGVKEPTIGDPSVIDAMQKKLQDHARKLTDLENKMLLVGQGGEGPDMAALDALFANLREECNSKFSLRRDHEALSSKVAGYDDKLIYFEERIKTLELQDRQLKEDFKRETEDLKQ